MRQLAEHMRMLKIRIATYDEGSDASLKEAVDKVGIEFDSSLVHRVIATTEGNDSRPG